MILIVCNERKRTFIEKILLIQQMMNVLYLSANLVTQYYGQEEESSQDDGGSKEKNTRMNLVVYQ